MADHQLIYVTLDLRRGLWVSENTGAKIVCAYRSDLLNQMPENGADIWCFEEEFPEADVPASTFLLLSRALTLGMLREIGKPLKFIVFKPSSKIRRWIENQGWKLLASDVSACKQLEDKLHFAELALQEDLSLPKHREVLWNNQGLEEYFDSFGEPFVVQGRMGHAGSSSYIQRRGEKLGLVDGTRVKLSEFIQGDTYTLNGYVDKKGTIAFGSLWKQLMNVSDWNEAELGTVGVSAVSDDELKRLDLVQLKNELEKLGSIFQQLDYTGTFGLDLIWNGDRWYFIECNARLTASVSLQAEQDRLSGKRLLLELHAQGADLEKHEYRFEEQPSQLSQVILRNTRKRVWKTPKMLKSGVYALNDEYEWELKSRQPILDDLQDDEFLLVLSRSPQSIIEAGSDYASIICKGTLHSEDEPLKEEIRDFYERVVLGHKVRDKDLWNDKYVKFKKTEDYPVFLLRRPLPKYLDLTQKVVRRHRQVEIIDGEVVKLRAQYRDFVLIEKFDGTRGWLHESHQLEEGMTKEQFMYPNKSEREAVEFLKEWLGTPYLWGGNSQEGVDCSAFVQRYFWEVKGILLPKYSQDQKASSSKKEDIVDMQDDDLLFMRSRKKGIAHVGVVKNGKVWHSSLETGVVEQSLEELQQKYEVEHLSQVEEGL